MQGVRPSPRGPGLVTFGPDRVKDFCKMNSLQIIVRAHECVMDGFERFAQVCLPASTNKNFIVYTSVTQRAPGPPRRGWQVSLLSVPLFSDQTAKFKAAENQSNRATAHVTLARPSSAPGHFRIGQN